MSGGGPGLDLDGLPLLPVLEVGEPEGFKDEVDRLRFKTTVGCPPTPLLLPSGTTIYIKNAVVRADICTDIPW